MGGLRTAILAGILRGAGGDPRLAYLRDEARRMDAELEVEMARAIHDAECDLLRESIDRVERAYFDNWDSIEKTPAAIRSWLLNDGTGAAIGIAIRLERNEWESVWADHQSREYLANAVAKWRSVSFIDDVETICETVALGRGYWRLAMERAEPWRLDR